MKSIFKVASSFTLFPFQIFPYLVRKSRSDCMFVFVDINTVPFYFFFFFHPFSPHCTPFRPNISRTQLHRFFTQFDSFRLLVWRKNFWRRWMNSGKNSSIFRKTEQPNTVNRNDSTKNHIIEKFPWRDTQTATSIWIVSSFFVLRCLLCLFHIFYIHFSWASIRDLHCYACARVRVCICVNLFWTSISSFYVLPFFFLRK